ncbi:MAG TPA: hypothetical protein P5069_06130 [Candidatus Hydrogenedentes bacterium]|nr:hypothetical protein [Candidatus Hydrogenedentota bacterium]
MSDVLRSFSTGTSVRKRRRELRRRAGRFGGWVLFAAAALLVAAWWTTRDTFAMGGLVPKDAAFQASVDNVMKKRALLAQSQLWELLPEESAGRGAVQAALSPAPLPEWLLNNLSSDISFWSSPRLDDFSELLVVSKMTRVGCLAVKLARFLPGIGRERAGGLFLQNEPGSGIHFAVRGRMLLLSPSRRALIHALTLDDGEALGEKALEDWHAGAARADLFARVSPSAWPGLEEWADQVSLSLRLQEKDAVLAVAVRLSAARREQVEALLPGLSPQPLPRPLPGIVSLTFNSGQPLPAAVRQVAAFTGKADLVGALLQPLPPEAGPHAILANLALGMLEQAGPSARLAWRGVDLNEMLPVPYAALAIDGGAEALAALRANPPAPPADNPEVDWIPRVLPDSPVVQVPLVGGPALKPCFAEYESGVLFSSNSEDILSLIAAQNPATEPAQGNLQIVLKPKEAVDALAGLYESYNEFGYIRADSAKKIGDALAAWRQFTARIGEMSLLARVESGEVSAMARVSMP